MLWELGGERVKIGQTIPPGELEDVADTHTYILYIHTYIHTYTHTYCTYIHSYIETELLRIRLLC